MRAVVQRVASASVTVDGKVISSISKGLMVLIGIGSDDTPADIDILSNKILSLRVFSDASGTMWKKSVKDISGEVLCVSQFTLMANTSKGNKPDFHRAMSSESSRQFYSAFLGKMRQLYVADRIQDGQFGAMMDVTLTNEGPITFTLDSRKFEYVTPMTHNNGGRKVEKPLKPGNSTLTPVDLEIASDP
ncbi:D-Tyr tRNAtyr deacylase-like domain-containing protein [Pisolithus orientalis]|uniref:D-Tyr tRNAtyr deacylase-like domain-containing protein n=1 Tax=Pisolithus orientalis TaxID=936130 RepID=UPI002225786C|nr:D-Tyr tRNAtyr deacylase-like domain-containing protein [Pisolithus orientalis]KAI6028596.1 D-Tyr tRNAtyr deacylase-like domain-containing protein [Pisolithus orientalis]